MRPRCGSISPAIMLTTEVLPAPERPNSAVTRASVSNATSRSRAPTLRATSIRSIFALSRLRRAPREELRREQRCQRHCYRDEAEPQRLQIAVRNLRIGVDGKRQGARFARYVRDESNRGAELPETARETKQHA